MAQAIVHIRENVVPFSSFSGEDMEKKPLTESAKRVLRFIKDYYNSSDAMPTIRQIMRYMGFKSTNSVYKQLKRLEDHGDIYKLYNGRISLTPPSEQKLPFQGDIKAGFAAPAEEACADLRSLNEFLIDNPDRTFMLRVSGDSMEGAGVLGGDYVLVERGVEAHSGQMVVACIDQGFTLKYFMKQGNKVFLRAANPKYDDFYPEEELSVFGVVVGVVRKVQYSERAKA